MEKIKIMRVKLKKKKNQQKFCFNDGIERKKTSKKVLRTKLEI